MTVEEKIAKLIKLSKESKKDNGDNYLLDLRSQDIEEFPSQILRLSGKAENLTCLLLDHNDLKQLPDEIASLKSLKKLSLAGNQLICFPHTIGSLESLVELNVNENSLTMFPDSLSCLTRLQSCSAIGNTLKQFCFGPLDGLSELRSLYLDENELRCLPKDIGTLYSLEILEASENRIEKLPDSIGNLKNLTTLSLGSNKIKELPDSFTTLPNLKTLVLSNNEIESLPASMASATNLVKLYLEGNHMKDLPAWFNKLFEITDLVLDDNQLLKQALPNEFCICAKKLKHLSVGGNFMTALPQTLGNLLKLEYLHLGSTMCELERRAFINGNWLKELPGSFITLTCLKELHLDENQIRFLPEEFGNLVSLEWLDLAQNLLEYLPDSFCNLTSLTYLQVTKNKLAELPKDIGNLENLIDIRIDGNQIIELPGSFKNLKSLQTVDLFNNHLTVIPSVLFELKNIKRLDLSQNNFALDLDKIPRIIPTNKYPERDPNLKGNWRGKTRRDKEKCEVTFITDMHTEDDIKNEEDDDISFNESALRRAMRAGMSLWRKHEGVAERQYDNRNRQSDEKQNTLSSFEDKQSSIKIDINSASSYHIKDDDENWSDEETKNCLVPSEPINVLSKYIENKEDWDKEVDEAHEIHRDVYDTHKIRENVSCELIDSFQSSLSEYPPCEQAYTEYACYDAFVYRDIKPVIVSDVKLTVFGPTQQGQFDDADED